MKVGIIGGGASGMFAGIFAAQNGAEVTLFEANEKLGKKLFITGKGRCNITNFSPADEFLQNVICNPKFLMSALNAFDSYACYDFFESNGLRLKIERGDRVFPDSDKSSDVIKTLEKLLQKNNVNIMLNTPVKNIIVKDNTAVGVVTSQGKFECDRVIIATGGITYKATGSTGDGFRFAKQLGHSVTKLNGGLVGVECFNCEPSLAGLTLKNVSVKCYSGGSMLNEQFGELLFTHCGISGPTVLTLSSYLAHEEHLENVYFSIDLKPALTCEMLDDRILRDFDANKNKQFKNSLAELLPKSLIPIIIKNSGINPDVQINSITAKQRKQLVDCLKDFRMTFKNFMDINTAIITCGGVDVKQINPKTMQSKIINNLYFCGEVLDVDALTGGYNLQIAYCTGVVAGTHSAKE